MYYRAMWDKATSGPSTLCSIQFFKRKVQKELTLGKLMTVEFGLIQYLDLDNAYMKFHVKQNTRIIMLQV